MTASAQPERRFADRLLQEIRDEQKEMRELLNTIGTKLQERHTYQLLAEKDIEQLKTEVLGQDGKSGLKAIVQGHSDRINIAIGAGLVLGSIGALFGWFADAMLKSLRGKI